MAASLTATRAAPGAVSASTAVIPSHNLAAGKLVVIYVRWEDSDRTPTVTDTAGNTYTPLTVYGATNVRTRMLYCLSSLAHTTNVITVDFGSATAYVHAAMDEWGGGTFTFVDSDGANSGSGATVDSASLTGLSGDGLVVACAGSYNAQTSVTGSTGYTANLILLTGTGNYASRSHKITSGTGTETPGVVFGVNSSVCIGSAAFTIVLAIEQEGFRFYADGTESGSVALAAQDVNVTQPLNTNTILRVLLNSTGDVATAQYLLYFKKSADADYRKVLTVAPTTPAFAAIGTNVGNVGVRNYPWPVHSAGQFALIVVETAGGEPASLSVPAGFAKYGDSIQSGTGIDGTCLTLFWNRATSSAMAEPTVADAGDHNGGRMYVFNNVRSVGDPIAAIASSIKDVASTSCSAPSIVTPVDNCLVLTIITNDLDLSTAQFSGLTNATLGTITEQNDSGQAQGNGGGHVLATAVMTTAGATGVTTGTVVSSMNASLTVALWPEDASVMVSTSANITASGENTTARLTAPAGKTTGDFDAGRISDDENPLDTIDITSDDYTEVAWVIKAASPAIGGDVYQFRVTVGGVALDTYTLTPQWTIGSSFSEAVGSSSGVGATSAIGNALKLAAGSAAGVGATSAVASSVSRFTAAAAGTGTTSAAGNALKLAAGSAAGVGLAAAASSFTQAVIVSMYLSGGGANSAPALSIGGVKSSVQAPQGLLGPVSAAQFASGISIYRCLYVQVNGPMDVRAIVQSDTPASDTIIAVGWGTAAVNASETAISDQHTAPTSVIFTSPTDLEEAPSGGLLTESQYRSLWVRYTASVGAAFHASESFALVLDAVVSLINLTIPVITGASTRSLSSGTYNSTPDSYSYRWKRHNDIVISGETAATHLLRGADLGPTRTPTGWSYELYDGGVCPVIESQTGVRYIDPINGSQANNGLTQGTAWLSLRSKAVSDAVCYVIGSGTLDLSAWTTSFIGGGAGAFTLSNVTIRPLGENRLILSNPDPAVGPAGIWLDSANAPADDVTIFNLGFIGWGQCILLHNAITNIRILKCLQQEARPASGADGNSQHGIYIGYSLGGVDPQYIEIAYCDGRHEGLNRRGAWLQFNAENDTGGNHYRVHHNYIKGIYAWGIVQEHNGISDVDIFNNTFDVNCVGHPVIEFASFEGINDVTDYHVRSNILVNNNATSGAITVVAGFTITFDRNVIWLPNVAGTGLVGATLSQVGWRIDPELDSNGMAESAVVQGVGSTRRSVSAWNGYGDGKLPTAIGRVDVGAFQYGDAGIQGRLVGEVTAVKTGYSDLVTLSDPVVIAEDSGLTLTQEGFRFYADGTQSGSTALAAQDTAISAALSTPIQLRVLVDSTNGPVLCSFGLQTKRTADGTWLDVPTESAVGAIPTQQAIGTAMAGVGALSPAWPTHVAGDIAILCVESCGGETVSLSTPADFLEVANSPQFTGTTTNGTRLAVFWCRATSAAMGAPTIADPGDHVFGRIFTARNCVVTGNPVNASAGSDKAAADTTASAPAVTTTVDNCLILHFITHDLDNTASLFTSETNAALSSSSVFQDSGTNQGNGGGLLGFRGGLASKGSSGTLTANVTSSVNASITIALAPINTSPVILAPSASITADGVVTTARLIAPSGKTTGDFSPGMLVDDSATLDETDIAAGQYTEVAWSIQIQSPAVVAEEYEFRVVADGVVLDTYSVTPELTVS